MFDSVYKELIVLLNTLLLQEAKLNVDSASFFSAPSTPGFLLPKHLPVSGDSPIPCRGENHSCENIEIPQAPSTADVISQLNAATAGVSEQPTPSIQINGESHSGTDSPLDSDRSSKSQSERVEEHKQNIKLEVEKQENTDNTDGKDEGGSS